MALVQDILGYSLKMDEKTGKITTKEVIVKTEKQTAKEKKFSSLPYCKLDRHFKRLEAIVREQENKAYAMGLDVFDWKNENGKSPRFEWANTPHGIDLVFVPPEKTKKKIA